MSDSKQVLPEKTFPPTISIDSVAPAECDVQVAGSASVDGAFIRVIIHNGDPESPADEKECQVNSFVWNADLRLSDGATGTWTAVACYRDMGTICDSDTFTANCPGSQV